jgi:hypothetical protein
MRRPSPVGLKQSGKSPARPDQAQALQNAQPVNCVAKLASRAATRCADFTTTPDREADNGRVEKAKPSKWW